MIGRPGEKSVLEITLNCITYICKEGNQYKVFQNVNLSHSPMSYAMKSAEKHFAPWLIDVSLWVFPPNTSMVPLMITAVCR